MSLDAEPSLLKNLAQLSRHMETIQRSREAIDVQMKDFATATRGLSTQARDVNEKIGGFQKQLSNIEAARKTVVKVADRFSELKRAEALLNEKNPDLNELLATLDSLREADRFAVKLSRGRAGSGGSTQGERASRLLAQAVEMVDARFRSMITQMARWEYDAYTRDAASPSPQGPLFMSPHEQAKLRAIVARLHSSAHVREFSEQLADAIRESFATFSFDALRGSEFYSPGTHPLLDGLAFYRSLVSSAQAFAKAIFTDATWSAFQDALSEDPGDGLQHLLSYSALGLVKRKVEAAVHGVSESCRVYVTLDLARDLCAPHWRGVLPSAGGSRSASGELHRLKGYVATQAVQLLNNHCVTAFVHDDDDEKKPSKTPSDGSILLRVIDAGHLVKQITDPQHYGKALFEECMALAPDLRLNFHGLQEYLNCVVHAVVDDVKQRGDHVKKEKKKPALATLFTLNNLHYLYHHLDLKDADVHYQGRRELYQDLLALKKSYIEASWGRVCGAVCDLRDGEGADHKAWIKKRFALFNKGVEECLAEGKDIAVPNASLRQELNNSIARYLAGPYRKFVEKYQHTSFSKTPDKYILYRERADGVSPFEVMLRKLFKNT